MTHPVDTSTWGEFKVGELFETNGKKTFTGASVNKTKLSDGQTPRITVTEKNNGIYGFYNDIDDANYRIYDKFISVSFLGTVFWHNYRASVDMKVHVLNKIKNIDWSDNIALFLITSIKKGISKFSYSDQLSASKLYELEIKLPLKQGTNPSDYSQDDIDWDYMESFMSCVQEVAKERLDNLPEPGQKSKTPIDVSTWGDFKVGELFDDIGRGTRIKKQDRAIGETPLVTAGYENQGVATYIRHNKELFHGPVLTIDMFGNVFARDYNFYADDNILVFKSSKYSFESLLFIASALTYLQTQYGYTNQFRQHSVPKTTVKLPLKSGANPTNYTQDDINWDYMESFMSQFQTLAKNRVEQLTQT